jgi:hypothetical protein
MSRVRGIVWGAAVGAVAGVIGAGAMVVGERVEQAVTRRPDSYVPARALLTLLGRRPGDGDKPAGWNRAMHYGTGATLGALRGVWAVTGIRGRPADAWHTVVRLGVDQTIENATGVGAPPASWPRRELVVDVLHKAVFSFVTGRVADAALAPLLASTRGRASH